MRVIVENWSPIELAKRVILIGNMTASTVDLNYFSSLVQNQMGKA